jgi:hypothetical protein
MHPVYSATERKSQMSNMVVVTMEPDGSINSFVMHWYGPFTWHEAEAWVEDNDPHIAFIVPKKEE